uniref:Uncharacterized protein n=1 Tax=Haemonchus contortus TaxID=6289 RepID=A0A7I5EDT1_HAECO
MREQPLCCYGHKIIRSEKKENSELKGSSHEELQKKGGGTWSRRTSPKSSQQNKMPQTDESGKRQHISGPCDCAACRKKKRKKNRKKDRKRKNRKKMTRKKSNRKTKKIGNSLRRETGKNHHDRREQQVFLSKQHNWFPRQFHGSIGGRPEVPEVEGRIRETFE